HILVRPKNICLSNALKVKGLQRGIQRVVKENIMSYKGEHKNYLALFIFAGINVTDLTELIYALQATGCINNGVVTIKELSAWLYSFFNVEAKDCYRFYVDIRRRKTVSKTVFIEKMRDALNDKLRKDDEKERARR
ncbi:MAG: RteC domain-containing protein, partial [Prevotella sp.]|nr:RteC domain-containing protein [Prevotella sp.]